MSAVTRGLVIREFVRAIPAQTTAGLRLHASFPKLAALPRRQTLQAVFPGTVASFSVRSAIERGARAMATAAVASDTTSLKGLDVVRIPCLSDNYAWLLINKESGKIAVVDTPDARPIKASLEKRGLKLNYILNTHHHHDHTGGNLALKKDFGAEIVGPKADRDRIPGIDVALGDGDSWDFAGLEMRVLDTPGHTRGHITLFFPGPGAVFTGDTMFAMGCGRLFEGTPEQMWKSLSKIMELPASTQVFCGHEYTASNAKFALSVNPGNASLQARKEQVDTLRSQGLATLPCTLEEEMQTNPFLRPSDPEIRKTLGIDASKSDAEALGVIRKAKDNF